MANILAATQPCADGASAAEHAGIAALPGLVEPPPARRVDRLGHGIALAAAALLHAGLLYALAQAPNDLAGGGGTTLDAIAITLVSSDILDSRSQHGSAKSAASTATVKAQAGSAAKQAAPAAPPVAPSKQEAAKSAAQQILASSAPASEKVPQPAAPVTDPPPPSATSTQAQPAAKPKTKLQPAAEARKATRAAAPPISANAGDTSAGDTSAGDTGVAGTSVGGVRARARTAAATHEAGAATASPGAVRAFAGKLRKALDDNPPSVIFGPEETGGTVSLQFALTADGTLRYVRLLQSSGIAHLDLAAVHAVKSADLPRPPDGMTPAELTYKMPYKFIR